MPRPPVSILLPARNAAATIDAALATVTAQRHEAFECVVVDDGSTDDTAGRVRRAARRDPRIRLVEGRGEGIVGALNRGLSACEAPLVARFDADDLMHRDRLCEQLAWLEANPRAAAVGSLVRCFPRSLLRDGMRRYEAFQNAHVAAEAMAAARFVEAPLVHPSVTLRRAALDAVGGWRAPGWPEDWDLWLRLFETGATLGKVPKTLLFWREHGARLTRTHPWYAAEALVRARAHYLVRGPLRDRPAIVWGAGPVGKALVKALDAAGGRVDAYADVDPRKIGQRVHGRPVLAARALRARDGVVLLAAVGAAGAREEIRADASSLGWREGVDFFACA